MGQTIKSLVEPFRFYPGGPSLVVGEIALKERVAFRKRLEAAGLDFDDSGVVTKMAEAIFWSRLTADEGVRLCTGEEAAALAGEVGERERDYLSQFFRVPRSEGRRNEPKKKGRTRRGASHVTVFEPRRAK